MLTPTIKTSKMCLISRTIMKFKITTVNLRSELRKIQNNLKLIILKSNLLTLIKENSHKAVLLLVTAQQPSWRIYSSSSRFRQKRYRMIWMSSIDHIFWHYFYFKVRKFYLFTVYKDMYDKQRNIEIYIHIYKIFC